MHRHTWKRLDKYSRNEWRCTTANSQKELEAGRYHETGCLATLVRFRKGHYNFSAPGTCVVTMTHMPTEMLIDAEYIAKVVLFNESLRSLAA
jgi:hypothetical protein